MVESVSLLEAARVELEGAFARLTRAQQALISFEREHGVLVGQERAFRVNSIEEGVALKQERLTLELELDSSIRLHQKCLKDWAQLKSEVSDGVS